MNDAPNFAWSNTTKNLWSSTHKMRLQIKEQFSNMQDFVILRCVRVSQFILQNWISKNNKREKRQTNRMARPRSHTHTFTHANNDLVRIGKLSAERRYCARTQTHTHTHVHRMNHCHLRGVRRTPPKKKSRIHESAPHTTSATRQVGKFAEIG